MQCHVVTLTYKIFLGYILETVKCRKWILDRDIVGVQRHGVNSI